MIEVARQNTTASTITQELYEVPDGKKTDSLVEILTTKGVDDQGNTLQAIIFVNSKLMAGRLSRQLNRYGFMEINLRKKELKPWEHLKTALSIIWLLRMWLHAALIFRICRWLSILIFLSWPKIMFTESAEPAVPVLKDWRSA